MLFKMTTPSRTKRTARQKFTMRKELVLFFLTMYFVSSSSAASSSPSSILFLDVDNTLYAERYHQIEAQLVPRIHQFVADELNLSISQAAVLADRLHAQFGSTIEGLRQTEWNKLEGNKLQEKQRAFYNTVYADVDCRSLLELKKQIPKKNEDDSSKTGYSHSETAYNMAAHQRQVRRILKSTANNGNDHDCTIQLHLASNSPLHHIQKVIQATGLARIPWKGLWTPDSNSTRRDKNVSFPTKLHPRDFWGSEFLQQQQQQNTNLILIDDSATTLAAVNKETDIMMDTIWLSSSDDTFPFTLPQALAVALGWLPNNNDDDNDSVNYVFSEVNYLRAKNVVDQQSIDAKTWMQMISELGDSLLQKQQQTTALQIVDVGAGLLSMLKLVLNGSEDSTNLQRKHQRQRLPSLLSTLYHNNGIQLEDLHYFAYEPNRSLEAECIKVLQSLGFVLQVKTDDEEQHLELVFVRRAQQRLPGQHQQLQQPRCTVYLRFWDFQQEPQLQINSSEQPTPHLIVGCCFADLLEPYALVASLTRCFLSRQPSDLKDTLVYFPITFAGTTQFLPPQPFEIPDNGKKPIPSDTTAFAFYSKCLSEELGHHLDPWLLETAVRDYGGTCLGRGKSDWIIEHDQGNNNPSYLWQTMLYFLGTVAAPELYCAGWDARGWLHRALTRRPTIQACNVDLLFRLPHLGEWNITATVAHNDGLLAPAETDNRTASFYEEILFTGPRQVTAVQKNIARKLSPDQIRIQTECSLISSGTELKIFTGSFDDAALDVNIKGMDEARMAYPLAYGYSLVGRVVDCGSDVDRDLVGKRVFTFSAHASQVVTTRSAVQLVPSGCDSLDAIFMPSVETALSLVHDASPRVGENVAVFGQGLIGLLVTAILSKQTTPSPSGRFGTITAFDTLPDRLAASARMGASQALFPNEAGRTLPFEVAIEVSGSGHALQSAIDNTRNGGRIVIGSWYGNADVLLKLGIDFHRSQKTLKVSQVSDISAELSKTWSKERRFALTWELVKTLRPSRLLTRITSLKEAQKAYESLEKGDEIAVAFEYKTNEC